MLSNRRCILLRQDNKVSHLSFEICGPKKNRLFAVCRNLLAACVFGDGLGAFRDGMFG